MKDNDVLINELREAFEKEKDRLGFKSEFDNVNRIFLLDDFILEEGYVSRRFSRILINRMVDRYSSWLSLLYSWLYPMPNDAISMNESKKLSSEERKEILRMIDKIMYFLRKNKRIIFSEFKDKDEAEIIDELVDFDKEFSGFLFKFLKKFEDVWKEEFSGE